MDSFKQIAGIALISIVVVLGLGAVFAIAIVWLWNQTMPELFGLRELTYWQALCLAWLCSLLFKPSPSPSTKGEDQLKELVGLQQRQTYLLEQIYEMQHSQGITFDDMRGSLQDISRSLDK